MTNIFDEHLPPVAPPSETREDPRPPRSRRRGIVALANGELKRGSIKLAEMAEEAFDTLRDAMRDADFPTAVQAAKLVLDRSGFGPSSTIKIEDELDLSEMSDAELAAIAAKLAIALDSNQSNHKSESTTSQSTPSVH